MKVFKEQIKFNESTFFYIVLPPIIFAEGYNMKRRRFFQNFSYIALFGVVGTVVNFVFNVMGAQYIDKQKWIYDQDGNHVKLSDEAILLISAVLSASDTVAAVSIIEESEAPKVRSILLGEGVMNDAVSIILFHSALGLGIYSVDGADVGTLISSFLTDMFGSVAVGMAFGALSALLTKWCDQLEKSASYETALLFFLAYAGYLITLILGFSGVISILVTGIFMGHYSWYNLSTEGRIVSRATFEVVGELLEAYVFVYVGFCTYEYYGLKTSVKFILLMVVVVLMGRFLAIVVLPGCIKLVSRAFELKWKELLTIWFAGSIRGAIAFALIISVPSRSVHFTEVLRTTVLGIVLFTTIGFGSIMPLLKKLVITIRHSQIIPSNHVRMSFEMMAENNDPMLSGEQQKTKLHQKWGELDNKYLKRWLIKSKNRPQNDEEEEKMHVSTQTLGAKYSAEGISLE